MTGTTTRDPGQPSRLFEALRQLAEQDPLIDARVDPRDGAVTVTIYGEVPTEVRAARLEEAYGVLADFLPTRVVHVERVAGIGEGHAVSPLGNVRVGVRLGPADRVSSWLPLSPGAVGPYLASTVACITLS